MAKYAHLEINRDLQAPAGYYTPLKEVRLKYGNREVLYTVSRAVVECSCCGACNFNSALVPGFIVKWQAEKNKEGNPVSEVQPVTGEKDREDIRKIIGENETISQTQFW